MGKNIRVNIHILVARSQQTIAGILMALNGNILLCFLLPLFQFYGSRVLAKRLRSTDATDFFLTAFKSIQFPFNRFYCDSFAGYIH